MVSDYEGVNLRWVAGQQSGYATLDGIRAAERYLKAPEKSTPVGMVGYSGGSIATDFGAELQPKYAKGLDIVGAAEGGVPVMLAHNLAYINGSPSWSGIIPAVIYSLGRAFGVNVFKYLSAYGVKLVRSEEGGCINSYLGKYPGLKYQKMLKPRYQEIFSIQALVKIVNRLIMSRTGTPKEPIMIGVGNADGTGDGVMVAADDEALAHAYCTRGLTVEFSEYSGLTPHRGRGAVRGGGQNFSDRAAGRASGAEPVRHDRQGQFAQADQTGEVRASSAARANPASRPRARLASGPRANPASAARANPASAARANEGFRDGATSVDFSHGGERVGERQGFSDGCFARGGRARRGRPGAGRGAKGARTAVRGHGPSGHRAALGSGAPG